MQQRVLRWGLCQKYANLSDAGDFFGILQHNAVLQFQSAETSIENMSFDCGETWNPLC